MHRGKVGEIELICELLKMNDRNQKIPGIVTLITDFGLEDSYVGQLKGAMLSTNSLLTIVDITHNIRPQDIQQAAYELFTSYKHFPCGTVHLVVVDPGVGTKRPILAARSRDHLFIAPDNGILSLLLGTDVIDKVVRVNVLEIKDISNTFHGRDIMAPIAAKLAMGEGIEPIGEPVHLEDCVRVALEGAVEIEGGLQGKVIRTDHFGNIRTSIQRNDFGSKPLNNVQVRYKEHFIPGIKKSYGDMPAGSLCCLFDSDGFLELARTNGSAEEFLKAAVNDVVTVLWSG